MMNVNCQKLLNAFFFFSCHKQIHISEQTILLNIPFLFFDFFFLFFFVKTHRGKQNPGNSYIFQNLKLKQYLEP